VFASSDIIGQVLAVRIESLERYSLLGELAGPSAPPASSPLSPAADLSPITDSFQLTRGA
jgi:tRNA-2-methylthio-N6-dimethylallyladenosine synthase